MFDFDPIYLFYLLIGASAAMFAEGMYLLFYNKSSYRQNINRRLKVMDDADRTAKACWSSFGASAGSPRAASIACR